MEAKEELNELGKIKNKIRSKELMIKTYRELATGLGAVSYEDVIKHKNNSEDPISSALTKVMDLELELINLNQEYNLQKIKIMDVIDKIENADYQTILIKRYFQRETWEEIASSLYCSRSGVFKMHKKALEEYSRKIE